MQQYVLLRAFYVMTYKKLDTSYHIMEFCHNMLYYSIPMVARFINSCTFICIWLYFFLGCMDIFIVHCCIQAGRTVNCIITVQC